MLMVLLLILFANNNSALFKYTSKIVSRTENDGRKGVRFMVRSKYLSNFWRTL